MIVTGNAVIVVTYTVPAGDWTVGYKVLVYSTATVVVMSVVVVDVVSVPVPKYPTSVIVVNTGSAVCVISTASILLLARVAFHPL